LARPFTTGGRLQTQTNSLGSTWVDVPNSATTNRVFVPIDPANTSVFIVSPRPENLRRGNNVIVGTKARFALPIDVSTRPLMKAAVNSHERAFLPSK
jgi:hypothetical protein